MTSWIEPGFATAYRASARPSASSRQCPAASDIDAVVESIAWAIRRRRNSLICVFPAEAMLVIPQTEAIPVSEPLCGHLVHGLILHDGRFSAASSSSRKPGLLSHWGRCGDFPARRGRPRLKALTQGKAFPTFCPQISNRNASRCQRHWLENLTMGIISHI